LPSFFEKQEIGSERCVLTHSYEAGWKIRHQTTSISDQCPSPQISLLVTSSKAVIKVLPAFEPCLCSHLELADHLEGGVETIDINFAYSRTQTRVLSETESTVAIARHKSAAFTQIGGYL